MAKTHFNNTTFNQKKSIDKIDTLLQSDLFSYLSASFTEIGQERIKVDVNST